MDVVGPICESSDVLGPGPHAAAAGGRRPGGDHRCRRLWGGDGVELQFAAERGRGDGRRRTVRGDHGRAPRPEQQFADERIPEWLTGERGRRRVGQAGEPMSERRPAPARAASASGCWLARLGRHRRAALAGTVADASRCSACSSRCPCSACGWSCRCRCMCRCSLAFAGAVRAARCGGRAPRLRLVARDAGLVAAGAGQRHPRTSRCARSTTRLPGDFADPGDPAAVGAASPAADRQPGAAAAEPAALGPAAPRPLGACARRCCWCWCWRWSMRGARSAPRLASGFSFGGRAAVASLPPTVDLWVTPPAYTRRAPLVSEQTRGVRVAGGADGQRGPAAGPSSARRRYGRGRLRRGRTVPFTSLGPGSGEATLTLDRDAVPVGPR